MSSTDDEPADKLERLRQPDRNETRKRNLPVESGRRRVRERQETGERKKSKLSPEKVVGETPLALLLYAQNEQRGWAGEAEEFFQTCINTLPANGRYSYPSKKKNVMRSIEKLYCEVSKLGRTFSQNKRVFQLLQFYQHYMDTCSVIQEANSPLSLKKAVTDGLAEIPRDWFDDKDEKRKKALEISMNIGGKPFVFTLTDSRNFQTMISFTGKSAQVEHSYDHIVPLLDRKITDSIAADQAQVISKRAEAILQAIVQSPENQPDWEKNDLLDEEQREAARELILLSQIAEAAAPDWQEVEALLSKPVDKRLPCAVKGGIGGMDKYARVLLRRIIRQEKTLTFTEAFHKETGCFYVNHDRGKRNMKVKLYRPENTSETRKAADICLSFSN